MFRERWRTKTSHFIDMAHFCRTEIRSLHVTCWKYLQCKLNSNKEKEITSLQFRKKKMVARHKIERHETLINNEHSEEVKDVCIVVWIRDDFRHERNLFLMMPAFKLMIIVDTPLQQFPFSRHTESAAMRKHSQRNQVVKYTKRRTDYVPAIVKISPLL